MNNVTYRFGQNIALNIFVCDWFAYNAKKVSQYTLGVYNIGVHRQHPHSLKIYWRDKMLGLRETN